MSGRAPMLAAGLLAVLGVLCIGLGVSSGRSREVAARGATSPAAATPVLSARRVPELLVRGLAARRLAAAVDPVVGPYGDQACLVVSERGSMLVDRRGDAAMSPASNQKLLVAAAALDRLGPDATLQTTIAAAGGLRDGTVEGDLWVIGGGDPVIESETYQATLRYGRSPHTSIESVADALVAAGVRTVTGAVKGDDSHYDDKRAVASWPGRYLSGGEVGPLSALALNDSRTYPVIAGSPGAARAAPDPAAYTASGLTDLLRVRGVKIAGSPGSGRAPSGLTTVKTVDSPPVRTLVAEMLTFSDNNTAELLVKELDRRNGGAGTTAGGVKVVASAVAHLGVDTATLAMVDGSGLDPSNRLTCSVLDEVLDDAGPSGDLSHGLAIAARSGTLADRFRRSPAAGRVRAKTGTLRDVTALSGWVRTHTEHDLAFSFIINTVGRTVTDSDKVAGERLTEAMLSYPDAPTEAEVGPRPPTT